MRILIDYGADVTATIKEVLTPLHLALNVDLARKLIQNGAIVHGCTLLNLAAAQGLTEIINPLLDMGATVDARNDGRYAPLQLSCCGGHLAAIRSLIASLVGTMHSMYI